MLTAGTWFGLRPTATPEPAQTPTQAPAPTARPESAGLGLPAAVPVTDTALDQIGPGWVLSVRQPVYEAVGAARSTTGSRRSSTSPSPGRRSTWCPPRASTSSSPPTSTRAALVVLTSWAPGATRVGVSGPTRPRRRLARRPPAGSTCARGAFTADDAVAPRPDVPDPTRSYKLAGAADGVELWLLPPEPGGYLRPGLRVLAGHAGTQGHLPGGGGQLFVDPTGRTFLAPRADGDYDLVSIADGTTRPVRIRVPGKDCAAVSWLDASTLLVACYDPWTRCAALGDVRTRRPALYRMDVTTQETALGPRGRP